MNESKKQSWREIAEEYVEALDIWKDTAGDKGTDVFNQLFIRTKMAIVEDAMRSRHQQTQTGGFAVSQPSAIRFSNVQPLQPGSFNTFNPRTATNAEWLSFLKYIDDTILLLEQIEMEKKAKRKAGQGPVVNLDATNEYLSRMKELFNQHDEEKKEEKKDDWDEGEKA